MKKIISFIMLLALLVSGCSQEEMLRHGTSASGEGRTFTTSFENDESRTYVENGLYSRWTEGDCISLFDASTLNNQYLFAGDTGDSGGTFFRLSKPEGTGTALSANYAVYPYDKDMTISADGLITLTLPSTQHYVENSYGLGDNTMVAVTDNADDTFLQFKNVGGCFKFQLYGDDVTVKSITLMGNNGEKIAGKAILAPAHDKAPVVSMADDATTSITLDCGEKGVKIGATDEEATAFWIVVPPTAFEKGITITVNDMDGKVFTQTTDKQLAIERNVVKPIVAVKVGLGDLSEDEGLEYQLLNYEEDGVDAIITKDGLFAVVKQASDSKDFVFITGDINQDMKPHMLIDEKGFLKVLDLGNDHVFHVLYTSKSLLLINSLGEMQHEIPFSAFVGKSMGTIDSRTFTDYGNPAWNCLQFMLDINDFLESPVEFHLKNLRRTYLEGKLGRFGAMVDDVLEFIADSNNIFGWCEIALRLQENSYFGNANLKSLDAIKKGVCAFTLPAQIEGLRLFTINNPYQKLLERKYTLDMETEKASEPEAENQMQKREISSDGIENFDFDFQELKTEYNYRASLVLEYSYETLIDMEAYDRANRLTPLAVEWTPDPQVYHVKCAIVGNVNSLVTGMVSSSVEEVRNPKMTSADVVCSFSDIPSGAVCEVLITKEGSDISLVFSGQSDKSNQEINVSGLSPSTSYVASSRIVHKGIPYPGDKSVSFSTPGPSGEIISVEERKRNSAVLKCLFSNVESGVECGIIVKNDEGYNRKQTVASTEGEQLVTISGLEPITEYTCTPYVKLTKPEGGAYYKEGIGLTFKTLPPDISGTWHCQEGTDSYTLTLQQDGSATCSLYDNIATGSWSFGEDGTVVVGIMTIATNTFNSGVQWEGVVDNVKNPKKITGSTYNWNYNHIGYFQGNSRKMVMTR